MMKKNSNYHWPEIAAFGFSIIAIVISGYSLLEGRRQHQDERNTEVLTAVYEDWVEMAMRDDWRVQHMMEVPGTYLSVRDLVRQSAANLSEDEKVRALLAERSTANLIFINFEHLFKQWMLAEKQNDLSRLDILAEEINFYAEEQLRNPRLLWYWNDDGGGWVRQADPSTIEWYKQRVLNDPDKPLEEVPDAVGVLPGLEWSNLPDSSSGP